jgi:hypothetical protein
LPGMRRPPFRRAHPDPCPRQRTCWHACWRVVLSLKTLIPLVLLTVKTLIPLVPLMAVLGCSGGAPARRRRSARSCRSWTADPRPPHRPDPTRRASELRASELRGDISRGWRCKRSLVDRSAPCSQAGGRAHAGASRIGAQVRTQGRCSSACNAEMSGGRPSACRETSVRDCTCRMPAALPYPSLPHRVQRIRRVNRTRCFRKPVLSVARGDEARMLRKAARQPSTAE